jgi:cyclohexadienyl dehydratase
VDDVRSGLYVLDRQHDIASSLSDALPGVPDGNRRTAPARPESRPARGLAGGTPIGDLGFRSVQRSCQKRRKSRRLEDGAEWVKRARSGPRAARTAWIALLGAVWLASAAAAREPKDALRVGTSADYAPFSHAKNERAQPEGFDVALLRAWAAERGRELSFVRFHWPQLLPMLAAGRFDVAASGITVQPDRSAAGRFTVAVVETEAIALARNPERWGKSATLDRPEVRIAVNRGGHLEQVARASFPNATLVAVPNNDQVIQLLLDEQVDAVVTDGAEAPHWEKRSEQPLARIGPLSRDRKAWLVRADQPELAADFDAWLLAREADGTIARLREQWLGGGGARTAEPLRALLAALDERLALMPLVGVVKRRDGVALVVPEREKLVLERALADLQAEAKRTNRKAPPDASVRALFEAQFEAARSVQLHAVKDSGYQPPEPLPDLEKELRPSLLRIGERSARLLLALPPGLDAAAVRTAARDELRAPYLDEEHRDAIADAIAACSTVR